jgi:6-phosphogluconolactonase (cycloisomerase 2 family)
VAANDFIYVANAAGAPSTVSAFTTDRTTGALTELSGSPYIAGSSAAAIAADPAGQFLFVANYSSGDISVFSINASTAALTPVSGSPFACEFGVDALAVDPTGRFLFAVGGVTGYMWTYSVSSTGVLTPHQPTPFNGAFTYNSASVTVAAAGDYVYIAEQYPQVYPQYPSIILAFYFDPVSGDTIPSMGFFFSVDGLANQLAIDPSGKFLLATGTQVTGTLGSVTVFRVDGVTGSLTPVAPAPPNFVQVGQDPAAVITDHSGKFVYIPNTADATVSAYTLDSSGTLTEIPGSPFPSGGNGSINGPTGITTDVGGQFIYVCNASNDVSVLRIDKNTGALSPVTGSPFPERGSGPHGIVFVHRP